MINDQDLFAFIVASYAKPEAPAPTPEPVKPAKPAKAAKAAQAAKVVDPPINIEVPPMGQPRLLSTVKHDPTLKGWVSGVPDGRKTIILDLLARRNMAIAYAADLLQVEDVDGFLAIAPEILAMRDITNIDPTKVSDDEMAVKIANQLARLEEARIDELCRQLAQYGEV